MWFSLNCAQYRDITNYLLAFDEEDEKNDKDHYNEMCFEPKTIPFTKQDFGTNLL